jgi:hypothetical protein
MKMNKQIAFLQLHIRYEVEEQEKEIAKYERMNKQMDFLQLHIRYENERKKKK